MLIGQHTPFSAANFVIGCPASLPTSIRSCLVGHHRSGVSETNCVARADEHALERMAPSIIALADHEGFPAHAAAIRRRQH